MSIKQTKWPAVLHRFATIEAADDCLDGENRTVNLSFSSEEPYERIWGIEILDHAPTSVRLDRLIDGGALLLNHDPDRQIGVVTAANCDSDKVCRATVKFSSSEAGQEIYQDVADGIRKKVSVGYRILKAVQEGTKADVPVFRVMDWEPFEISLVSIPADPTVGVGRSDDLPPPQQPLTNVIDLKKETLMSDQTIEVRQATEDATNQTLRRVTEILAIGKQFTKYDGDALAEKFIQENRTVEDFQKEMLQIVATKNPLPNPEIGMTKKDIKNFSFVRLINALSNPNDMKMQREAAFELELSQAARQHNGVSTTKGAGATIPYDVLANSLERDLTVAVAADGGNTVATNLLGGSFIDLLRHKLAITQVGATMLTGLTGNVAIPRQSASSTAFWVAENAAPTESQQTIAQVTLTPKTVGAFTDYSRRLLLQGAIDVESFVRNDLLQVLALAIDLAAISGSGSSNQPRGITNTVGIGSVAGGTNGAQVTWQNIIDLEAAVANANADMGNLAYLTNSRQRARFKAILQATNTAQFIWQGGELPVNGYRCAISNQVPFNLTKGTSNGVCSAIIFGNFTDLLIGMWGGLDLTIDPYTGSSAGTVRVVALQDVDINVRNVVSFAAMLDAL
jgi:HK97 family phage major capsid protein